VSVLQGEGAVGAADQRPLTQQEYQAVQRLFSDPFSFPISFKTWLVSFLEASDLNLPFSAVNGLVNILGITGTGSGTLGILPAGLIFPYGGAAAPTGSLMCDGSSYAKADYDRLFQAIQYSFGGSGPNFSVPDIRERIPVGLGATPAHNALGLTENMPFGQRGTKHNHQVRDPGHAHTAQANQDGSTSGGWNAFPTTDHAADSTAPINGSGTGIGVGPAGGVPTDTPAFITINYIIVA